MSKKVESDLKKMNKDRRRAEEEYLDHQQFKLEIARIQREGIVEWDDLINYIGGVIEDVKHSEDIARLGNNPIAYSESIGIRREFIKLLQLLALAESRAENEKEELEDGTEEAHRAKNGGDESYA